MEKEKKIYLMLTRTRTNVARIIRLFTQKPYNHISIALDEDLDRLYSFGRRTIRNPFNGGFVQEKINEGFYQHFSDTICVIYEMTVTEEQYQRLEEFLVPFLEYPKKYRFNFIGTVTSVLHIPFARKNCYFCSQFVSEALHHSGIIKFDRDFRLIRPFDFFELDNAVEIYRGKLDEYTPQIKVSPLSAPIHTNS